MKGWVLPAVAVGMLASASIASAQTDTSVSAPADTTAGASTATTASTTTATPAATTSAPPPAGAPTAAAAATAAAADDHAAREAEHRRHRHFYVDLAGGYTYINLVQLNQSNFVPNPSLLSSSGYVGELGVGFQLSMFRFGVAGSYSRYQNFDVATAEVDLALVIPTPIVEPYIELGLGYGAIRNVDVVWSGMSQVVAIHGIAADLSIGLDFHLSDAIQLGVGADASLLNLQRQPVTAVNTIPNFDFTKSGSALGIQIHGLARLTFQF